MLKLSIILPFYNVEKYIATCLDSIYKQGLPEDQFEIICIDDCSPDNSAEIVQSYIKRYTNIKLIKHEQNKGLGGGRNTGLNHAKGEYVWFVDTDDTIVDYKLFDLLEKFKTSLDVLLFNYQRVDDSLQLIDKAIVFPNSEIKNGIDYVQTYFKNNFVYNLGYVWRCFYRREYLIKNKIYFPENELWEDTEFFPKAILLAEKVQSIEDIVYNYRANIESISGTKNRLKADQIFQFAFNAGFNLFSFSQEFKDIEQEIANDLEKKSIWYFNSFVKPLSLTNFIEKRLFFKLVRKNKELIEKIYPYLSRRSRLIINPILGLIISIALKPAYMLKESKKSK